MLDFCTRGALLLQLAAVMFARSKAFFTAVGQPHIGGQNFFVAFVVNQSLGIHAEAQRIGKTLLLGLLLAVFRFAAQNQGNDFVALAGLLEMLDLFLHIHGLSRTRRAQINQKL